MTLTSEFQSVVDALPSDWTDLEFDLRIFDEARYVEAAVLMTQCNAQPYSNHDWHWRVLVANGFGHGAAPEAVTATLKLLDANQFAGELEVRELRSGRSEIVQMWGRPEAVRREFRERRSI
ncbi:MAG: hypothetical protein JHC87_09015 [Thermoleophilaceae bacterium]|nr:hypothetical protein [Thermoleophilaceae bacterium]MBJ7348694.1 hypothetical protein [Thermoleophilaceae bacterium]